MPLPAESYPNAMNNSDAIGRFKLKRWNGPSNYGSTADLQFMEDFLPLVRRSPGAQQWLSSRINLDRVLTDTVRIIPNGVEQVQTVGHGWALFRIHWHAAGLSGQSCVIPACFPEAARRQGSASFTEFV